MNDDERQKLLDQGAEAERKRIAELCLDKARTASNRPRVRAYSELYDDLVGTERRGRMTLEQARVLFPPHTMVEYDAENALGERITVIRMVIDAPELGDDVDDDISVEGDERVFVPIGYDDEGQISLPAEHLRVVDVPALRHELEQARKDARESEDLHLQLLHAAAAALELDLSDRHAPPTFVLDKLRAAKFQGLPCKHEPFEYRMMGMATPVVFGIPHDALRTPLTRSGTPTPSPAPSGPWDHTHEVYGCRHCGTLYASLPIGVRKIAADEEESRHQPYKRMALDEMRCGTRVRVHALDPGRCVLCWTGRIEGAVDGAILVKDDRGGVTARVPPFALEKLEDGT